MRNVGRHRDVDQIKAELRLRFPRYKVDIVHKCYNLRLHANDFDCRSGDNPQLKPSFFTTNPHVQTFVHECFRRACLLWAGGHSCIWVVCIGDQITRLSPSIVVSSTLQAVFQHAGYNSIGPLELHAGYNSVGLSSSATYAGSASHTCSVEVERGFHVVCPLTSESLVGVRR